MAIYSDLSYSFELEVDGNLKLVTNLDSIKQALKTLFFTRKGIRVMDADFGAEIDNYLFEQLSEATAHEIGRLAVRTIEKYEPRIEILELHVEADFDNLSYNLSLSYRVPTYEFTEDIFIFNTVLLIK